MIDAPSALDIDTRPLKQYAVPVNVPVIYGETAILVEARDRYDALEQAAHTIRMRGWAGWIIGTARPLVPERSEQ